MYNYAVKKSTFLVFWISFEIVNNLKCSAARRVNNIAIDEIKANIMVKLVKIFRFSYVRKFLLGNK